MMLQTKYLKNLSILALAISLSSCASDRVIVKTEYVRQNIPLQVHPAPLQLNGVKWDVVTRENLQEFVEEFEKINGDLVFFAVNVPGYENMALNLAEIRRYIEQQKAIIVYYEDMIKNEEVPEDKEEVIEEGTFSKIKAKIGLK